MCSTLTELNIVRGDEPVIIIPKGEYDKLFVTIKRSEYEELKNAYECRQSQLRSMSDNFTKRKAEKEKLYASGIVERPKRGRPRKNPSL